MNTSFRVFARLSSVALIATSLFGAMPASAATISAGDLIKASGQAVYYYGTDGKRYVFPNERTYFSWYSDFSTVKTITDGELAAIMIGGNVTYKPGTKLVKITTDTKVYAVDAHGTLRPIASEAVASALYGSDWNKKVDDLPDAFFINYSVGSSVTAASDFSPASVAAAATSIASDKSAAIPTAPAPTTPATTTPAVTASYTLVASKTSAQAGDMITLTATAQGANLSRVDIFFDGTIARSCTFSPCTTDVTIPISNTKSSYATYAKFMMVNDGTEQRDLTIDITTATSSLVSVKLGQSQVAPGQNYSIITEVDAGIAVLRIDLLLNGSIVKGCTGGIRLCQFSDVVPGGIGSTYPVTAKVTDTIGRIYQSKTIYLTVGTSDTPSVTVDTGKTAIYAGETIDVTVSASDSDGIASIDVTKDGAVLKHCVGAQPCTATTGPWSATGTISFAGKATDAKGNVGTADTISITVMGK